MEVQPENK